MNWSARFEVWKWIRAEVKGHEEYPYSHPHQALTFGNSDELIRAVTSSGSHFFSPDTMRWFRCRVYELVNGKFLLLSNMSPEGRVYQVAYVTNPREGTRLTVERSPYFRTMSRARAFARELVVLLEAVPDTAELIRRAKKEDHGPE